MKLSDFLVPKWKNSNPAVRLKAVMEMNNDNIDVLEKIVFHDKAPEVRLEALKKISSEPVLEKVYLIDNDTSVKEAVYSILNQNKVEKVLLTDNQDKQLSLIKQIEDSNSLLSVFKKIESPDIRAAIVEQTDEPKILCEMAESNCGIKAGSLIIDKINDIDLLKKISENASNKKIRRKAADKINPDIKKTVSEELTESSEINLDEKAEAVCTTLESFFSLNDCQLIDEALSKAVKEWGIIPPEHKKKFSERFREAAAKLEDKKLRLIKTEKTIKTLQYLCSTAKELSESDKINNELRQQADHLEKEWESSKSGLNNFTIYNSLHSDFTQYISVVRKKHDQYIEKTEKESAGINELQDIIDSIEKTLALDSNSVDETVISAFEKRWNAHYFDSETSCILKEKFNTALTSVRKKIDENHKLQIQKQDEHIASLIVLVKDASEVEDKDLNKTAGAVRDTVKSWKKLGDISDQTKQDEFNKYCDIFFERLDEKKKNREWELWANLSLKKELCEKAEKTALSAETANDLSGFSQIIREAQASWKEIGSVTKEHSDSIWETFQSACDRVYSICLKEKERLFNEAKEAVSSENFNEVSTQLIQIQESWNNIGSLPLAIEKDLRESFKQLCDTFFSEKKDFIKQKNKEREDNYLKKVSLCEEAEALLSLTPDGKVTERVKNLQSDWKKTGPAPRDKSEQIWDRFKLACDTYFSKIEETKPENLKIKTGFCETAEEILKSAVDGSDIRDACNTIIALQKSWKEIGPVPHEHSEPLWKRFRSACDSVFQLRDEAEKKLTTDQERNREIKEELISQAKKVVEDTESKSTAGKLKELQKQWKETGSASRKDEQDLWQKFREINDSFFNKRREEFLNRENERNKNLKIKEDLCLTLELLAKIVSEKSDTDYDDQVPLAEQLSIARELWATYHVPGDKKATKANIMRKVKEIQAEWKSTGSAGSEHEKNLWERYKKAGDLFYS